MPSKCIGLFLCFLSLSACMVGPDFKRPHAPAVGAYTPNPQLKRTQNTPSLPNSGKVQTIRYGQALPIDWWRLFHSKEINALVAAGLRHSPTITAAQQNLVQAYEILAAQIGSGLLPAINAGLTGQRQRFSNSSFGSANPTTNLFNLFNASFTASYTLDFFGGIRRQIEAYSAQVDYQAYEMQATYLNLTSSIVSTAINTASLREQIKATLALIKLQKNALYILRKQFQLGGISRISVLTQETEVQQTIATLPALTQALNQNQHALSVLIGEFPSENALPKIHLDRLILPANIPVSVPSMLVHQRPDIMASEALLHVASAEVGVATANLYPQITLTGNYGWQGSTLSKLITPDNNVWNITGSILQPLFNGGALLAQKRAAVAGFKSALAQYQQTVLQAFQNVADQLRAIENDAQALKAQRAAEIAAKLSLDLTQQQFNLGGTTFLNLLIAQQQYQRAMIGRIRAQAGRYTDTAALFQALGGGWWCPFDVMQAMRCCGSGCLVTTKVQRSHA